MSQHVINTTFVVEDSLADTFLTWARDTYLPALKGSGHFHSIHVARILQRLDDFSLSYAIHTVTGDLDAATLWGDTNGAGLIANLTDRYPRRILHFTTVMELLSL